MSSSAINSLGTAAASTASTGTSATTANAGSSLTASDFINMMLTELQNQDPLQPTDTSSLLTQISQVGQLQSTSSLQSSISSLALQNSIGAASSLIGKTVTGLDSTNKVPLSGIVNSIQVSGGTVNLQLDNGGVMPLPNVSTITPTVTTGTATASSGTTGGATTSSSAATSGA